MNNSFLTLSHDDFNQLLAYALSELVFKNEVIVKSVMITTNAEGTTSHFEIEYHNYPMRVKQLREKVMVDLPIQETEK